MSYLTTEKKTNIFTEFGGKAENTGSIEAQIALFTERITSISKHLKSNKKDFDTNTVLCIWLVSVNVCLLIFKNITCRVIVH